MGVPAFYRWLSEKYPKIVVDMLEQRTMVVEGVEIPVNLMEPNPNNLEFDNLFVDMNGLIHPCSHPEDREAPTSEEEMYVNVMKYVDRLFAAVRPRRLLYLAIDGVAPRAKMNQQRSRRFRAVQDAMERQRTMDDARQEMLELGLNVPPKKEGAEWDSNVITPGTEFMHRLSAYLRFYILERMNKNPAWKNIKVILSDASEPGEGEHKIMNFIRNQRCQPGYDPNQRHVIHGLDADLIMLALATHEPHFTVLREKVTFGKKDRDKPTKSDAQKFLEAQANTEGAAISALHPEDEWVYGKPLQALHVDVLREYLIGEFKTLQYGLPFEYDFERVLDDFVFMCFFVGNDFLPHLPSLDIRDGAIDFLMYCYKEMLASLGDYLTSPGGEVNLHQADVLLSRVGEIEEEVFRRRKQSEEEEDQKREFYKQRNAAVKAAGGSAKLETATMTAHGSTAIPVNQPTNVDPRKNNRRQIVSLAQLPSSASASASQDNSTFNVQANQLAAKRLRDSILGKRTVDESSADNKEDSHAKVAKVDDEIETMVDANNEDIAVTADEAVMVDEDLDDDVDEEEARLDPIIKAVLPENLLSPEEIEETKTELKRRVKDREGKMLDGYKESVKDHVRLYELGWKERYYQDKYKKEDVEQGGGLKHMCFTYVQGLCWVLKYYYVGCPSWNWYYPFHYAPFASDLVNIDQYTISFELSVPFRPVEQLLAVLPAESVNALPEECRWLMTDSSSPIRDIYISDAPLDPNGKHLPWLWVLLLPFVDEKRISAAFAQCKDSLALESRRKNAFGKSVIFIHQENDIATSYSATTTYDVGVESDNEVILALQALSAASISDQYCADNPPNEVFFDPSKGNGICGITSNPPPTLYVPQQAKISALKKPPGSFDDINGNQVMCLTYSLPADVRVSSALLHGVIFRPSTLTEYDLLPRRPPRLGKGSFNMLNLVTGTLHNINNSHHNGNNNNNYRQLNGTNMHHQPRGPHNYDSNDRRHPNSNNNNGNYRERHVNQTNKDRRSEYQQQPVHSYTSSYPQQPMQPYQQPSYSNPSYQLPYAFQQPSQPPQFAPRQPPPYPYLQQPPQALNTRQAPLPPAPPGRFSFNQTMNYQAAPAPPMHVPSLDQMRAQLSQVLHTRQNPPPFPPRGPPSQPQNHGRNNYSGGRR